MSGDAFGQRRIEAHTVEVRRKGCLVQPFPILLQLYHVETVLYAGLFFLNKLFH